MIAIKRVFGKTHCRKSALSAQSPSADEVKIPVDGAFLSEAIADLLRGTPSDLDAYLHLLDKKADFNGLRVNIHCHAILCNQQGARVNDLARTIAKRIVDYSIPRSEFKKAKELDEEFNTDVHSAELRMKARELFADVTKTGEGGEILLYMLIQTYLRLPQLLCKMALKTNSNVHVHGVDGVHVDIDSKDGHLVLYWGESKLYKDPTKAVSASLNSLRPYLTDEGGSGSPLERDLFLLRDNLDLNDPRIQTALLNILDRDKPEFNSIEYRGAALVGFSCDGYPVQPNALDKEAVKTALLAQLPAWLKSIETFLKKDSKLSTFSLEIFMIPFPDVQKFRGAFIKEIRQS